MPLPWQDILALAVVGGAAVYLAWHAFRVLFRRAGKACGGGACTGCGASQPATQPREIPLVSVKEIADLRERQ